MFLWSWGDTLQIRYCCLRYEVFYGSAWWYMIACIKAWYNILESTIIVVSRWKQTIWKYHCIYKTGWKVDIFEQYKIKYNSCNSTIESISSKFYTNALLSILHNYQIFETEPWLWRIVTKILKPSNPRLHMCRLGWMHWYGKINIRLLLLSMTISHF